ncbi:bacterial regulatory protein, luxR family protein [Asticcacaulis biprosthecium C19]|uniref:Bacterial regulatory protein, luxR family protein n=1 Tax=Asticcacaulis biprosthecium C19 TaxID=715226 RepID=F4QSE4_9CAUL|nr:LuxR C-terminal-related transcriptional regulator [Asticcacaulis biprosthecium]EGF89664.1 bacterial regulatory protein, luxR family protein [Asticcacaulis biprosthecium C19]
MPSYVRTRLLAAREFATGELAELRARHPAYDRAIIESLRKVIPFDYFFFSGVDLDNCHTGANMVLMSDMPEAGIAEYHASGLVRADPLLTLVTVERPDLSWFDVPEEVKARPEVRALVSLLDQHHIPPRVIFSQWNSAGDPYGTAGYARTEPFSADEMAILSWFSRRIHKDLCEPVLNGFNQQIGLTAGETTCLELASRGMTSEEIGAQMDLTTETVNSYMKLITRKLGARNRSQAIADALRLNLIR